MLVAPKPIADQVRHSARQFLTAMREEDYDYIWDHMITLDAIELISTAIFPIQMHQEGRIDDLLTHLDLNDFSFAFQLNVTSSGDDQGLRSGLFTGMATSLQSNGWLELFEDNESFVFLWDAAAVLIADGRAAGIKIMLPFIRDTSLQYKVDFEAMLAFSMFVSAKKLHQLATRAMEIGQTRTALTIYEIAARLKSAYIRLQRLIWDHPFVSRFITELRKQELQAEYAYTVLAQDEVQLLLAEPTIAEPSVDVGKFLRETFRGYDHILSVDVDQHDLDRVIGMDDGALRIAISKMLNSVDPVEAQREARKPHTSAEIADMEVMVKGDGQLYHLLIPVKSGKEIKGNSVPVEVFYQILRPHLFFEKGIVVFITAKPCSQFLMNYIKQARDRLNWPIGVIEGHELAALLKINDLG